jgi:inner membrane protein
VPAATSPFLEGLFSGSFLSGVVYRPGHYGAALLAYAPVAVVLALAGRSDLAVIGGAIALALTPVPDYDMRLPLVSHRGVTHTVGFALLVGGVLGGAGLVLAGGTGVPMALLYGAFGFTVGVVAIGSHLLADVVTPAGISPLWPLSGRTYSLRLVRADDTLANWGLLAAGVFVTAVVAVVFLG